MLTRPLAGDSRLVLLLLAGEMMADAGVALVDLCRRVSRHGRMVRQVQALEDAGLINRGGVGPLDERVVRLTDAGHRVLWGALDPEALWRRRWDGMWRMAMFDVPESRNAMRARIRRNLRDLRFGWLQNSVWLSPDPVSQLMQVLTDERISVESLLFMEGRPAGGETDAELVAGGWDFEKLARLHAVYLKFLETRPRAGRAGKGGGWAAWLVAEERAWREIVRHDPFLPSVLLPRDYAGRAVWEARRKAFSASARALLETARDPSG
jgi:DNA-binding transcriptional regulator PaaX